MEIIANYFLRERQLGLTAGLFGLTSLIVGLLVFIFMPKFKAFSITLLILGMIEAGVFLVVYFRSEGNAQYQIEQYNKNPNKYITQQTLHTEKALNSFFWLKLLYATLLLIATVASSKLNLGNSTNEILYALIIHLALAITIDNFGEQYTQSYQQELKQF